MASCVAIVITTESYAFLSHLLPFMIPGGLGGTPEEALKALDTAVKAFLKTAKEPVERVVVVASEGKATREAKRLKADKGDTFTEVLKFATKHVSPHAEEGLSARGVQVRALKGDEQDINGKKVHWEVLPTDGRKPEGPASEGNPAMPSWRRLVGKPKSPVVVYGEISSAAGED
eukprot:TRINITY_DN8816_c0_g1_i2.p1 TRINITY_DN8816_c0_g1~~TRINITY_DN8816_c0_g1_i2.p1  ORF type:complete len:174 (-),score=47.63 TRINITY_DN8816_c0_g1_i2:239-760(-)